MLRIDNERAVVVVDDEGEEREIPFSSPEAFAIVSKLWLRVGWDTKYVYSFAWMGRPIIQLPEDMMRIQEVIYQVKPTVVIETGVAHGGSLIFYASLLSAMGGGRVVGIDIEIRAHNRAAIEAHEMFPHITLIEGSSIDQGIVDQAAALIGPDDRVLVMLDSNHTRDHVRAELERYAPLVTKDSYIVAADGIMQDLSDAPRGSEDWTWNNPAEAAQEFVATHSEFVLEEPPW
ncbi:MAG TPA: hydroxylase, partial [Lentisphaeria bacterium]|nr:hydroxylase [Lentisphaeria bacterium]